MGAEVLLISSEIGTACGIAEHSRLLMEYVEPHGLRFYADHRFLDPAICYRDWRVGWPITILNYHRALHSRWTPKHVAQLKEWTKVVIIFHDTFGELPPDDLSRQLCKIADAFIVHEPCVGLEKAIYWRMGVPDWPDRLVPTLESDGRPVVGTIGFPFPWKNYDRLCEITAAIGWGVRLIAPTATEEQIMQWQQLNRHCSVISQFLDRREAVRALAACDATAFLFTCANTGQSASILQGVSARKPVLAFSSCRQMRALYLDPLGHESIRWCTTFEEVKQTLRHLPIQRVDPATVALAEQDSWVGLGKKYADLLRSLL